MSRYAKKAERQGPCLICGNPGCLARHRLWDAIDSAQRIDRWSTSMICKEWYLDAAEIRWIAKAYSHARKHHTPLPGRKGWRDIE